MADWAIWMLLAGILVVAELFTGTFYLLMLAIGVAAGGIAAYGGVAVEWQLLIAAAVGIAATGLLRRSRLGRHRSVAAARDPNVSMDIGQTIHVDAWHNTGQSGGQGIYSARVPYRGALWDVDLEAGADIAGGAPAAGPFIIREIRGSRLIVAASS